MSGVTTASTAWARRFHSSPGHRCRLICFPHAGGAATAYYALSRIAAPDVEVLALQYPGRQDRRAEGLIKDIPTLADLAHRALLPWTDEPFALFGHSMGATLAFEVALRMEAARTGAPERLFVSGRRAPSHQRREWAHLLSDKELVEQIKALGGTDAGVLDDAEMQELVLPVIRNDYRAIETHRDRAEASLLRTPVTALVGDRDPRATVQEVAAWEQHTSAGFDLHVFQGAGHFYFDEYGQEMCEQITGRLPEHA